MRGRQQETAGAWEIGTWLWELRELTPHGQWGDRLKALGIGNLRITVTGR